MKRHCWTKICTSRSNLLYLANTIAPCINLLVVFVTGQPVHTTSDIRSPNYDLLAYA